MKTVIAAFFVVISFNAFAKDCLDCRKAEAESVSLLREISALTPINPAELDGKWMPEKCLQFGSNGIRVIYNFNSSTGRVDSVSKAYDDLNCTQNERIVGGSTGPFTITAIDPDISVSDPSARQLNLKFEGVDLGITECRAVYRFVDGKIQIKFIYTKNDTAETIDLDKAKVFIKVQ